MRPPRRVVPLLAAVLFSCGRDDAPTAPAGDPGDARAAERLRMAAQVAERGVRDPRVLSWCCWPLRR